MFKMKFTILSLLFFCSLVALAHADVMFLPGESSNNNSNSSSQNQPEQKCRAEGYTLTSCLAHYRLANPCPYHRLYYKSCCSEEYAFSKEDCLKAGLRASRDTCGGLYKCL